MSPINPFNWQTLIAINTYIYSLSVHLQHKFMLRSVDPFQIVIALISDMFECHNDPVIRRHTHTHTYTVDVCIFTLPLTNINTKVAFPALFVFNYVYLCKAQALTQTHVKAPHTDTTRFCVGGSGEAWVNLAY